MSIRIAKRYTIEASEDLTTEELLRHKASMQNYLNNAKGKILQAELKLELALVDAALAYKVNKK